MATINRAAGSDDLAMGGADPRRQVVGTGEITQSTAEEEEGERYPPGRKLLQADDRAALPPAATDCHDGIEEDRIGLSGRILMDWQTVRIAAGGCLLVRLPSLHLSAPAPPAGTQNATNPTGRRLPLADDLVHSPLILYLGVMV